MSDEVSSIVAAKSAVAALVAKFKLNEQEYLSNQYNETQARTDFVTPLLEAFGWDVHNQKGYSQSLREVIEEATVEVAQFLDTVENGYGSDVISELRNMIFD